MKTENKIRSRGLGTALTLTLTLAAIVATLFVPGTADAREQQDDPGALRSVKVAVRDRRGRPVTGADVMVGVKGGNVLLPLDENGSRVLDVTEGDTIVLTTGNKVYDLPVEGLDSLLVTFRNRNRVGFILSKDGTDEDISLGYGSISNRNRTTAVGSLDVENAENYADLKSYIAGRIAGVQFQGDQLIVRGMSSFNDNNEALIVVDGMVMQSFAAANQSLTPKDVANITVLKDSSAAIYGSQAANGVVLITTKGSRAEK